MVEEIFFRLMVSLAKKEVAEGIFFLLKVSSADKVADGGIFFPLKVSLFAENVKILMIEDLYFLSEI